MSEVVKDVAVRRTITVEAPVERAFAVFTEQFDTWWPAEYYIGGTPPEVRTLQPRAGGRWFERSAAGEECDWGQVLAWEPPRRLVLSWGINGEWKYEPERARASEVEVLFTPEGPGSTRVDLEHRNIERHGDGWESVFAGVDSPGGWTGVLERYAAAAGGAR
jgi:uncharacterized protein YndB with AHSA1/START domain